MPVRALQHSKSLIDEVFTSEYKKPNARKGITTKSRIGYTFAKSWYKKPNARKGLTIEGRFRGNRPLSIKNKCPEGLFYVLTLMFSQGRWFTI